MLLLPLVEGDAEEEPLLDLLGSLVAEDDGMVDDGEVALLPLLVPAPDDCANANDDTDAIMTNDSDRIVGFSLMRKLLKLKERHHRCSSLDASPVCAFSRTRRGSQGGSAGFFQALEF
ncbi:hypothetical protein [Herbaspirillum sp. ST 5-3]|uniref:hypothetical protein n=1 Tax=Oxalobacteraceae TaxID=75682 RepID=UPI0010A2FE92|nr:hypothetical protein [Herbaspirillum sp. ST 5-3]